MTLQQEEEMLMETLLVANLEPFLLMCYFATMIILQLLPSSTVILLTCVLARLEATDRLRHRTHHKERRISPQQRHQRCVHSHLFWPHPHTSNKTYTYTHGFMHTLSPMQIINIISMIMYYHANHQHHEYDHVLPMHSLSPWVWSIMYYQCIHYYC